MQSMKENKHITDEMWIALSDNTVAHKDYMKILEHTCGCTWCAERLASSLEGTEAKEEPPAYLEAQILERVERMDVQAVTMATKISKRLRLFLYSLKVGLAVTVSVFLLTISMNMQELGTGEFWDSARRGGIQTSQEDLRGQASKDREEQKQEDGLLMRMNQVSQKAAAWMNGFSDQILLILDGGN